MSKIDRKPVYIKTQIHSMVKTGADYLSSLYNKHYSQQEFIEKLIENHIKKFIENEYKEWKIDQAKTKSWQQMSMEEILDIVMKNEE